MRCSEHPARAISGILILTSLLVLQGCYESNPTSAPQPARIASATPSVEPAVAENGAVDAQRQPTSTIAEPTSPVPVHEPKKPRVPREFTYDTQLGIATVWEADDGCMTIRNPSLSPHTAATLVWVPTWDEGPKILKARVLEKLDLSCNRKLHQKQGASFYRLEAVEDLAGSFGIYFVVVDPGDTLTIHGGYVEGDLENDGIIEVFRACTSNEGSHLTVWSGPVGKGHPRWHRYFYAGYGTEPTCDDNDYFGDAS